MKGNYFEKAWENGFQGTMLVSQSIYTGTKGKTVFANRPQLKKDILKGSILAQVKPSSMLSSLLEEIRCMLFIHHINDKQTNVH